MLDERIAARPSTITTSRRTKVGEKWPGIYERVNGQGERVLEFDYYDETGRRRWHSMPVTATLKQAQAAREDYRGKRRRGERFAPAKAPTIEECWERWLATASVSLRPRTIENYSHSFRQRIVPKLGRVRVSALDRQRVASFVRELQSDKLAGWTIRGTLVALGLFLSWAEDEGYRVGNPVRDLRRRERPKVDKKPHRNLTEADLWKLVDSATDDRKALVGLLAFAGLRVSEMLGLAWADVDLDGREIRVRRQLERYTLERVEPKTSQAVRSIEIDDGLVAVLRAWKLKSAYSQAQHLVVVTRDGRPIDQRAAGRALEAVVKMAGLNVEGEPKITPHQLRYSYGSLLIDAGVPTSTVARMMGHANEAITGSIYAHEIKRRDGGDRTREGLSAAFGRGTVVERRGGNGRVGPRAAGTVKARKQAVSGTGGE